MRRGVVPFPNRSVFDIFVCKMHYSSIIEYCHTDDILV